MAAPNTKQRSLELQAAATALVADIDVTQVIPIRKLAKKLEARTGCEYSTAKRHIAKAARRKRYGLIQEHSNWGGPRPGAGKPPKDRQDE